MGNFPMDSASCGDAAAIHTFYSSASWIEGAALDQLNQVAHLPGVHQVTAFPDLHPGKYGPVGCAILADRVYPHLVGNDIGCGMSLYALDMPLRKLRIDKAAEKLRVLEGPWTGDASRFLAEAGLPEIMHDNALGTIGGGNHFCELQAIQEIMDQSQANLIGISRSSTLLLVHSGSRIHGMNIFGHVQQMGIAGFAIGSPDADAYLEQHDHAVAWASLNRQIVAERAAEALRTDCRLIADAPHNLAELKDDAVLHRKGAVKADIPYVPLAGSRDALSFLLKPVGNVGRSLSSLAHGSGRKYDRRSMMGRIGNSKAEREKLTRTSFGGQVICEDRQLLIEEAPGAYKSSGTVLDDLIAGGLARCIASLKPVITFKKAS